MLTVLLAVFFVFDAVPKSAGALVVVATQQMGFPASSVPVIGSVLRYAWRSTSCRARPSWALSC